MNKLTIAAAGVVAMLATSVLFAYPVRSPLQKMTLYTIAGRTSQKRSSFSTTLSLPVRSPKTPR